TVPAPLQIETEAGDARQVDGLLAEAKVAVAVVDARGRAVVDGEVVGRIEGLASLAGVVRDRQIRQAASRPARVEREQIRVRRLVDVLEDQTLVRDCAAYPPSCELGHVPAVVHAGRSADRRRRPRVTA